MKKLPAPSPAAGRGAALQEELRRLRIELQIERGERADQETELVTVQRELEASRAHYAELYDSAPIGYLTLDGNGLILQLNLAAAALLGAERTYLLRHPLRPFIAAEHRQRLWEHLARCRHEPFVVTEFALQPLNAALRQVQLVTVAWEDRERARRGFSALIDITERKAAEQALRDSHDLLERRVLERTAALRQANDQLQHAMSERLQLEKLVLDIAEVERQRLGRDLHDGLGQHLTALSYVAQVLHDQLAARGAPEANAINTLLQQINSAIHQTTTLAHTLVPVELQTSGLPTALQRLALSVQESLHIPCACRVDEQITVANPEVARQLYRLAQEALDNAAKHRHATKLWLRLERTDGLLWLVIKDNGRSLTTEKDSPASLGLHMINYRADVLGAHLKIDSRPGHGCTVTCRLKLPQPIPETKASPKARSRSPESRTPSRPKS